MQMVIIKLYYGILCFYTPSITWSFPITMLKSIFQSIIDVQLDSVKIIADTPLGASGMFDKIIGGLTVFATIACIYKLVVHFQNTERFDNVKAYTGFFSYFSVLILFIFSSKIVSYLANLNSEINTSNIRSVITIIDDKVNEDAIADFKVHLEEMKKLEDKRGKTSDWSIMETMSLDLQIMVSKFTFPVSKLLKYLFFGIFGGILAGSLAIPVVVLTFMVKILLSIMILGAKIVFLLAFIPGFENAWKTYLLNLLNVLLWIPIFNVIIAFILTIVSTTITNYGGGIGMIIWLSILTLILATQSISLTTTVAGTIVSGNGAGLAAGFGSMSGMSAAGVIGGVVALGVAAVGGGVAVASKFSEK